MKSVREFSYVPAFDGLRAVAVIAVMIFHSGIPILTGGFIGVDVFFVLSGFLITLLLSKELLSTGSISLRNFYIRRFLRLSPALLVLLAAFTLASLLILDQERLSRNLSDVVVAGLYMSNWARAFDVSPPYYLGHTWSLAIEEQFYLLWPVLMLLIVRRGQSPRGVFLMLAALIVSSYVWRAILLAGDASIARLYNGLDTRAESLLAGALLAFAFIYRNALMEHLQQRAATFVGPAIVALLVIALSADWKATETYLIHMPVVELAVLILICNILLSQRSLIRSALSFGPLVWVGKLSYGLYLWHYPIMRILAVEARLEWHYVLFLGFVFSFAAATASFYLIELRALKLKKRFQPNSSQSPLAVGAELVDRPSVT